MENFEFDSVYLEFDDGKKEILKSAKIEDEKTEVIVKGKTTKLSINELQKRLDETQSLHVMKED